MVPELHPPVCLQPRQDAPRMSLQRSPGAGRLAEAAHRVGAPSRAGRESLG